MNALLVLPVLIPLLTAALCLLAWRHRVLQRWLAVIGSGALLASGLALLYTCCREGILATQLGSWPAPFGITFVADLFSAILVVLAGLVGFAVAIYSLGGMDAPRESFGYYPLMHLLLMGVCGAFLTGDLFNLYVWFEVMLIASFVLLALGGERAQMEGAIKYVTLNLISSAIFLAALGILYGVVGTLNMADLSMKMDDVTYPGLSTTLAMLFLVAFGIKAAIFPLFFWLPSSYHTPPAAVSALFAGLLTKVGVYSLIRVFTLIFLQDTAYTHWLILWIAALTMVSGVLGAMIQGEFRRILSFHSVSQVGYMLMGLGLFTHLAVAGSIFFIVHHGLVKSSLFLISGVANRLRGSYRLDRLGGLLKDRPALSLLFLVFALSLSGIPPLSGFWAKFALLWAGLETKQWIVAGAALGVSLLTLYSMTKIWNEAFWQTRPAPISDPQSEGGSLRFMYFSIIGLAAIVCWIGFAAQPFLDLSMRAAGQLLDPSQYISAVLGRNP